MRCVISGCIAALMVALVAPSSGLADEKPVGWAECLAIANDAGQWPDCAQIVSAECLAVRQSDGDEAWAVCLKATAETWEQALVQQSLALRERGSPAGDSAALSRWMASRASRCHRQSEIDRMTAEFGETQAAAAVFQCELASNIEEVARLAEINGTP